MMQVLLVFVLLCLASLLIAIGWRVWVKPPRCATPRCNRPPIRKQQFCHPCRTRRLTEEAFAKQRPARVSDRWKPQ